MSDDPYEQAATAEHGPDNEGKDSHVKGPDTVNSIWCADIHLSDRPPSARVAEPDWFKAQARVLDQVKALMLKHTCPLFIAGDIFNRWDASAALISLWLEVMGLGKNIFAVPGNHDTPGKQYSQLKKSAYWTLVKAGSIIHLPPCATYSPVQCPMLFVTGFPDGFAVKPPSQQHSLYTSVALIHDYIWCSGKGRENAPVDKGYSKWMPRLNGYDIAVFGDNHIGFLVGSTKPAVFNCGTLQCRATSERAYKPRVGLLRNDNVMQQHFLDTSLDKWTDLSDEVAAIEKSAEIDLSEFIEDMGRLRDMGLNWKQAVYDEVSKRGLSGNVQDIIHQCVEGP